MPDPNNCILTSPFLKGRLRGIKKEHAFPLLKNYFLVPDPNHSFGERVEGEIEKNVQNLFFDA